jgi:predicted amidohydrolase
MENKRFKVAAAQMDCVLGVVQPNLEKMKDMCQEAAKQGAIAICFPEVATTGYSPVLINERFYEISEPIPGPATEFLSGAAMENHIYIITGISEKSAVPGKLYNSQICISPEGKIISNYRKIHVWGLEKLYWKSSTTGEFGLFDLPFCKAGTMICYDTVFPETARVLTLMGSQIIFDSAAWRIQESDIWDLVTRARALENHVFMVCSNRCGKEGDTVLTGESRVIGPRGNILEAAGHDETLIMAEIDLDLITAETAREPYLKDRCPEAYGLISDCGNF